MDGVDQGDGGPIGPGPRGISAEAKWLISAASGQAAAKARGTQDMVSMTRAPNFSSLLRMVENSALARA